MLIQGILQGISLLNKRVKRLKVEGGWKRRIKEISDRQNQHHKQNGPDLRAKVTCAWLPMRAGGEAAHQKMRSIQYPSGHVYVDNGFVGI